MGRSLVKDWQCWMAVGLTCSHMRSFHVVSQRHTTGNMLPVTLCATLLVFSLGMRLACLLPSPYMWSDSFSQQWPKVREIVVLVQFTSTTCMNVISTNWKAWPYSGIWDSECLLLRPDWRVTLSVRSAREWEGGACFLSSCVVAVCRCSIVHCLPIKVSTISFSCSWSWELLACCLNQRDRVAANGVRVYWWQLRR